MEWISLKDKFPEEMKTVLGIVQGNTTKTRYRLLIVYLGGSSFREFYSDDRIEKFGIVTHWMPLPELPEKEG